MKIRNLNQYIELLSERKQGNRIGVLAKDVWLQHLEGKVEANMDNFIGGISSFASESEIQVIYEFLQNAEDAKATEFCYFFDDEYLMIFNNGKPFYTDKSKNKGQLERFLTRKKSDKKPEDGDIGNRGQGSKLLYNLFLDSGVQTGKIGKESDFSNRIKKAILDEHKGPILFSWSSSENTTTDLDLLISNKTPLIHADCTGISHPLLTKIIYTYYPSLPNEKKITYRGEENVLFTHAEFTDFIRFVGKHRTKIDSFPRQGSILLIKLGTGQSVKLDKAVKSNKLLLDIEISLFFLSKVTRVRLNDQVINKLSFHQHYRLVELFLYDEDNSKTDNKFRIVIPKNVSEFNTSNLISNFFFYFPVTSETHGYKFVIDTDLYKINDDRQNIDIGEENTQNVLNQISQRLSIYLSELRSQNKKEEFIEFFLSILYSSIEEVDSTKPIYRTFLNVLKEAIRLNIPSLNGFVDSPIKVKFKDTKLNVSLLSLGLNYDWVSPELENHRRILKNHFIELERWNVLNICHNIPVEKLREWVRKMSKEEYNLLFDELSKYTSSPDSIENYPLFRFENDQIYSLKEIIDSDNLLFITERIDELRAFLTKKSDLICGKLSFPSDSKLFSGVYSKLDDSQLLLPKVISIINSIRTKLDTDEKCSIVTILKTNFKEERKIKHLISNTLSIFKNYSGEYKSLGLLLRSANQIANNNSGILNRYQIAASEKHEEYNEFYLAKEDIWRVFYNDWDEDIKSSWENQKHSIEAFYKDLTVIYSLSNEEGKRDCNPDENTFLYSQSGFVENKELFYSNKIRALSSSDYETIVDFLKTISTFNFVRHNLLEILEQSPLKTSYLKPTPVNLKKRISTENWITINLDELSILKNIKGENSLFECFILKEEEGLLLIKKKNEEEQYDYPDDVLNEYLATQGKYFLIPQAVRNIFLSDLYFKIDDEGNVIKLIKEYKAHPALINIVNTKGNDVKKQYLYFTPELKLSSTDENYSMNSFESKLISLSIQQDYVTHLRNKTLIDETEFSKFIYSDKIQINIRRKVDELSFSLAGLIKDYEGVTDKLQEIKEKFENDQIANSFFAQESMPPKLIKDKIVEKDTYSIEQVYFLCAYALMKEQKEQVGAWKTHITDKIEKSSINETKLLDIFYKDGVKLFPEVCVMQRFEPQNHFIDVKDFLLVNSGEEKLPNWVVKWIKVNTNEEVGKKKFLIKSGVNTSESPPIKIRLNVAQDNPVIEGNLVQLSEEKYKRHFTNTLKWVYEENTGKEVIGRLLGNIKKLIHYYTIAFNDLPPYFVFISNINDENKLVLEFNFVNPSNETKVYLDINEDYGKLRDAIKRYNLEIVYAISWEEKFIERLRGDGYKAISIDKEFLHEQVVANEWRESYYLEWITDDNVKHRVFLTDSEFAFKYYVKLDEERKEIAIYDDGNHAFNEDKETGLKNIYLYTEYFQESVLNVLIDKKEMFFKTSSEKDYLLKLIRLAQLVSIKSNEKVVTDAKFELIKHLEELGILTTEAIDRLIELGIGKGGKGDGEGEGESKKKDVKPNILTGHQGEIIIYHYLKCRFSSYDVVWASKDENEPAFDFMVHEKGDREKVLFYFDAKTTGRSDLTPDSIPFYVKESQLKFLSKLKKRGKKNYILIRLNLNDMQEEGIKAIILDLDIKENNYKLLDYSIEKPADCEKYIDIIEKNSDFLNLSKADL